MIENEQLGVELAEFSAALMQERATKAGMTLEEYFQSALRNGMEILGHYGINSGQQCITLLAVTERTDKNGNVLPDHTVVIDPHMLSRATTFVDSMGYSQLIAPLPKRSLDIDNDLLYTVRIEAGFLGVEENVLQSYLVAMVQPVIDDARDESSAVLINNGIDEILMFRDFTV